MHEISKRQGRLLKLLLENPDFLPVSYYAQILAVSDRTIYKDLKKLEEHLQESDSLIEKSPRKGIRLQKTEVDCLSKKITERINLTDVEDSSPIRRQLTIARYLLVENKVISYQQLAEQFLISKTSIANDIEQIQLIIDNCNLEIVSDNNGTKIMGKESNIQKGIKNYAYFILDKTAASKEFKPQLSEMLLSFLPQSIFNRVVKILQKENQFGTENLSDDHFQSLVLSISILIVRLQQGFHIEKQTYFLYENIESLKTFLFTSELANELPAIDSSLMTTDDFNYLNRQLIAHGFEPELQDEVLKEKYDLLVKEMIREMSHSINVNLTGDQQLYTSILYHFAAMIYRLTLNIPVKNPLLEEIKAEYSVLFSTTWLILARFETELEIRLTEDEVAFMMIHFQGAIDRASDNRRILIVCPTGIGTSELVANRLRRVLSAQDILEVVSLRALYKSDLSKVDLIVSSVKLEPMDKPVIYVSPLMSREDLKKVSAAYLDLFYTEETAEIKKEFNYLGKILKPETIFLDQKMTTKAACLDKLTAELVEQQVVTLEFERSIWEREKMGVTDLPTGVAIPHPTPSVVKESCLVVVTLAKPIRWHTRMVNTILMVCIAEKDLRQVKGILSEVYSIVESRKNVEECFFSKTKEQIIHRLGGNKGD